MSEYFSFQEQLHDTMDELRELKRQLAERDAEIERQREKTRWRSWLDSSPANETCWPVLICNDDEGGDTFLSNGYNMLDRSWDCEDGIQRPIANYCNWLPVSPLCPIPTEDNATPADGSSGYSEAPERAVVFYQEGDDPFICHYAGHPDGIEGIESELSYQEWPHGDGEYTFDCYYMDGREPGESKGWDLYLRGFSSIPTEEG